MYLIGLRLLGDGRLSLRQITHASNIGDASISVECSEAWYLPIRVGWELLSVVHRYLLLRVVVLILVHGLVRELLGNHGDWVEWFLLLCTRIEWRLVVLLIE